MVVGGRGQCVIVLEGGGVCVFSVKVKNTLREVRSSGTLLWSPFSKG